MIRGGVNFVHIDIMDGHYVPNIFFPLSIVQAVRKRYPNLTIDVHLMVTNPEDYVDRMREDGADYLSFHIDSTRFSRRLIDSIQQSGMKAGVVINPSQPISLLEPLVRFVDYVVLMTVEPGFCRTTFLCMTPLERLDELQKLKKETDAHFMISIDGGIDREHSAECMKRGAEILVSGIYTVSVSRRIGKGLCQLPERDGDDSEGGWIYRHGRHMLMRERKHIVKLLC